MKNNIVTLSDSYKFGHYNQYPKNTEVVYSYFESRQGAKFNETVFFGLQYLIKEYLQGVVVTQEKIDKAEELANAHFNMNGTFNKKMWEHILNKHGGKLPIKIKAIPEGTPVPVNNVLMTIENTDPECYALTNYLETLLCHLWASSTCATLSREIKKMCSEYLYLTSDNQECVNFMLHDFGFRGVSSVESAGIEGAGHLLNFLGTDTIKAMETAIEYYNADLNGLAYSVPATEHSVMTALGRDGEVEVVKQLLENYPTGILSIVGDSYDIYNFAEHILGDVFKNEILNRNGKVVCRPDSGDPIEITEKLLNIFADKFGYTINSKNYKVLNNHIGLLWGDGIDINDIKNILENITNKGWSAENIVFGMGGGLLQKINRDTQRFAFKSSAQKRNGIWYDIYKDPKHSNKTSKKGLLKLIKDNNEYKTVAINCEGDDLLETVFEDGVLVKEYNFSDIRKNAKL